MKKRTTSSSGFTLIELLVVIVIMAVLVSLGFTGYRAAKYSSQRKAAAAEIGLFKLKLNDFKLDYGFLPKSTFVGGTPPLSAREPGIYDANPEEQTYQQSSRVLFLALTGRTTFEESESKGRAYLNPQKKDVGSPDMGPGSAEIYADERRTYTEQAFESGSYFLDPWGNPYGYYYDPENPKWKAFNSSSGFDVWSTAHQTEDTPKVRRKWVTNWN